MEKVREMLGRLAQLTAEELDELRQLVSTEFDALDGEDVSVDDTAILVELAEIADQILAEGQTREQAATEAQAARDAAREKISAIAKTEDPEAEAEEKPEEAEEEEKPEPEAEEDAPVDGEGVEQPEPVLATGTVQRMARKAGKPVPSPEVADQQPSGAVLTASSGYQAGRPITDRLDLAREMISHLDRLNREMPYGKVIVASAQFDYPESRKLGMDAWENEDIIRQVLHDQRVDPKDRTSLVATGGICQPVDVDYNIPTWATAETPIVDDLPGFEATRGGVRYIGPPDIAEWEPATGIWTAATDLEPGGATKPIKSMACGEEKVVVVEAIPTRIGFGNMQSRFAPEQVAANTDMAIAASARVRERNLLNLIEAVCVKDITSSKLLGATRDLISVIQPVIANYRDVHRLPDTQAITAIFPRWVKNMIKADLAREIGHAQTSYFDALRIPDSYVEDMLRDAGLNPIFHLDGQPVNAKYPTQQFTELTKEAGYHKFPEKMVWYMFAEDMIQRLDAGRLDLGVVRDSTLDATNDYETFVEVFESIAFRGFPGGALQMVTELCAMGGSTGTVAAACS